METINNNVVEINTKAYELNSILEKIHSKLDEVNTPNLSRIKEIFKRINFANINNKQQILDNKGDVFYKIRADEYGDYFNNLTLDYTIQSKVTGLVYGLFSEDTDKEGNKKVKFTSGTFNNYARFIADLVSQKVIYSEEIENFILIEKYSYKIIDSVNFSSEYPVDKKNRIDDFLEVIDKIFSEIIDCMHNYTVFPYIFTGKDWFYDCKNLKLGYAPPKTNELYFQYFPVKLDELDFKTAKDFLRIITDNENSLHNLSLVHAYVMQRKLNLVHAEKWFLLKDFGRSGKGLFMETFPALVQVNKVNFDALSSKGFESTNEWLNFYGADVAYANETGEINTRDMRILRKIATAETVTGRLIGQNAISFKNRAVLILDTNDPVDIGEITANKSRTVKISLKDRPKDELEEQRYKTFEPYWEFIKPNDEYSISASVSFLINSLDYLRRTGKRFNFNDVSLKNYFSADDLTETQKMMLEIISEKGYILSGDNTLQECIENDYGSLRYKQAKKDIKNIGVKLGENKFIGGKSYKVNIIGNKDTFQQALNLLKEN